MGPGEEVEALDTILEEMEATVDTAMEGLGLIVMTMEASTLDQIMEAMVTVDTTMEDLDQAMVTMDSILDQTTMEGLVPTMDTTAATLATMEDHPPIIMEDMEMEDTIQALLTAMDGRMVIKDGTLEDKSI